jgi:cytochrome c
VKTKQYSAGRLSGVVVRTAKAVVTSLFLVTGHAADIENGKALFEEHCVVCHTTIESVRDKSGPNLNGVVGRKAGADEYLHGYSNELIESGVTWEVATIQAFINSPALMVRGTKMVFRGLPDFETRLDIACYLESATGDDTAGLNELCAGD